MKSIPMPRVIIIYLLGVLLFSCSQGNNSGINESESTTRFNSELGIEAVPASLGQDVLDNFNRYTRVIAPNGKSIHIVIQSEITDEQAVRCRGILEHFLRDLPGSKYGINKGEIANKMTENNAILALMNGQDDGNNEVRINAQPLFKNEIQVEGHEWYVNQDYTYRDASYEEILHFVHDNGIGIDGSNSMIGAAPELQKEIRAAQVNGLALGLWADDEAAQDWINELVEENSLSQEYLAAVIDCYYGLWGAWNGKGRGVRDSTKAMWGLYSAKTRDQLETHDPLAYELMDGKFFHPYLTYNARIDENFRGAFSLKFNTAIPYTHHSQYLKDITLLGDNDTNVRVNELNNIVTGNEGVNTVIFSGRAEEYQIDTEGSVTKVIDSILDRDGINLLNEVEKVEFEDKTLIIDVLDTAN